MSHDRSASSISEVFGGNIYLQMCAGTILIAGIAEIIIGALIRNTVDGGFGAWWAGVGCAIGGFMGLMQGTPSLRSMAYCFGILASLFAVAGLITDGIGFGIVRVLDTCMSDDGIYGSTTAEAVSDVTQCYAQHSNWDCTCINVNADDYCYSYNLVHDKGNCEQILGYYTDTLYKSTQCLDFLVFMTIAYCIYLCTVHMCSQACAPMCLPGCCDQYTGPGPSTTQQTQFGTGPVPAGVGVPGAGPTVYVVQPASNPLQQQQQPQQQLSTVLPPTAYYGSGASVATATVVGNADAIEGHQKHKL